MPEKDRILDDSFFNRTAPAVARDLIGKFLVRRVGRKRTALMITEAEAYHGFNDKASHASRGRTARTEPMFAEGGTLYVYFTYGMYWMLNVVCGPRDYPSGVLIRGAGHIAGPGRLTRELEIDKTLNGKKLGVRTGLWIEDRGVKVPRLHVHKTPRIGIDYAGEWKHKEWRFVHAPTAKRKGRKS